MDVADPKIPGHNAEQIEYFYENDFDQSKKIGFVSIFQPLNNMKSPVTQTTHFSDFPIGNFIFKHTRLL